MERRKVLAGMGSLAAGAAAATGTGAFDQLVADREVRLQIAYDDNGMLGLSPADRGGSNPYASLSADGDLELDFTSNGRASGINNRADTVFEEVYNIRNQGTQPVWVWISFANPSNGDPIDPTSGAAESVEFVVDDGGSKDLTHPPNTSKGTRSRSLGVTSDSGAVRLHPGDEKSVTIRFLVTGTNDPGDFDFFAVHSATSGNEPDSESDWKVGINKPQAPNS